MLVFFIYEEVCRGGGYIFGQNYLAVKGEHFGVLVETRCCLSRGEM